MIGLVTDEQLARQLQEGDEAALEILVHRYYRQIHAYVVRMSGECNSADDIVQEVFFKVCRHIGRYRVDLSFRPWIYTIASNACKDYMRKAYAQRDVPGLELGEEIAVTVETPETAFLANLERENVLAALKRIGDIHREVLILRYYQELKLDEIALVLRIPVGTVKSRLSAALHKLKTVLVEEVGDNVNTAKR